MFHRTPDTEPSHDVTVPSDLIPLSQLALDVDPPSVGWDAYLTGRGIPIVLDHIGRSAVSSADAGQLLIERREDEARRREVAARQEQAAIERDRVFRAALPTGLHWTDIPVGASAAEVWAQQEKDAKPKRRTPLEDALAGDGMIYRPLRDDGNES